MTELFLTLIALACLACAGMVWAIHDRDKPMAICFAIMAWAFALFSIYPLSY